MIARTAEDKDFDQVLMYAYAIVEQHQRYNPDRFSRFKDHRVRLGAFLRKELHNPRSRILLLEEQEEIVGYALVRMEEADLVDIALERAWIHDLYLAEKVRGRGAGKILLQAAVEAARALGSQVVMLQVASQNDHAKAFFQHCGFEVATYEMMLKL